MTSYIIALDSKQFNYVVALEDSFGFVPLFGTNDYAEAEERYEYAKRNLPVFTKHTENLMATY